jgi:hypothetical protein
MAGTDAARRSSPRRRGVIGKRCHRLAMGRNHGPLRARRAAQRRRLFGLCRAGSCADLEARRHRRHGQLSARRGRLACSARLPQACGYSPDLNPIDPSAGSGGLREAQKTVATSRGAHQRRRLADRHIASLGSALSAFPRRVPTPMPMERISMRHVRDDTKTLVAICRRINNTRIARRLTEIANDYGTDKGPAHGDRHGLLDQDRVVIIPTDSIAGPRIGNPMMLKNHMGSPSAWYMLSAYHVPPKKNCR